MRRAIQEEMLQAMLEGGAVRQVLVSRHLDKWTQVKNQINDATGALSPRRATLGDPMQLQDPLAFSVKYPLRQIKYRSVWTTSPNAWDFTA